MLRVLRWSILAAICLGLPVRALAAPSVITFDSLSELDSVTNQFAGATFSNATVLAAGSVLNNLEFPPHSGANVVVDDGGAISISFASPIAAFGGFFTYGVPLTLTAFNASHTSLGFVTSAFSNNELVSGDPSSAPNEFLQFASGLGISSVTIEGDPAGGSFVLDDATMTPRTTSSPVPEPGTLALVLVGAVGFARRFRPGGR